MAKVKKMRSDIEIAQSIKLRPIEEIGAKIGLRRKDLELHGDYIAKIKLDVIDRLKKKKKNAKYIDVTAITPTPLGEGKTVTTIGAGLALNYIGKKAIIAIRQPSMGPTFGIKGGAAGGGYSQALPMEDFNLHLTGDIHAVSIAHNLCSAYLDNHMAKGNKLNIDPSTITWRRVVDVSDRMLRQIVTGLGGKLNGFPRESGFDIAVASEVMAILALTTGLKDIRKRLGKIVVAFSKTGKPVTAEDLKVAGAMAVLMKDAIKPNLMQTTEHTPVLVHAGPFANIAHGNSSILADMIGIKSAEYLVTESGFGADIGMEKFLNIKCRMSGLVPDAVVLVATIRALKMHSGKFRVVAGRPLDKAITTENIPALEEGICNLEKHIENVKLHGLECVVAINQFGTDTKDEIKFVKRYAEKAGALAAVPSQVHAKGGRGGVKLAEAIVAAAEKKTTFKYLYPNSMSIKEKIETIATKVYGADGVDFSAKANQQIERYTKEGYDKLPICMAKSHLSLSHDPKLKGRPTGFTVPIREIRASVGAGFLYPLCGAMSTMPGLPSSPAGERVDFAKDGRVVGLF